MSVTNTAQSLENSLEKAFGVLCSEEDLLAPLEASGAILFVTEDTGGAKYQADGTSQDKPMPNLTIKVTRSKERMGPGTGVYELTLDVSLSDNVEREGSSGKILDTMWNVVCGVMQRADFAGAMSAEISPLTVHAILFRENGSQTTNGSIVTRQRSATLIAMEL